MNPEMRKRLDRIEEEAKKTFGDEFSKTWVNKPSRHFNHRSPIAYVRETGNDKKVRELMKSFRDADFHG